MPFSYAQAQAHYRATGRFLPQTKKDLRVHSLAIQRDMSKIGPQRKKARYSPYSRNSTGYAPHSGVSPTLTNAELNAAYDRVMAQVQKNTRTGGFLDKELKFLDTELDSTNTIPASTTGAEFPPTSGCTGCISSPAQGDGPSQRDGKKIILKEVFINGEVHRPAGTGLTSAPVDLSGFVALVLDTQTNAAQLSSENVYNATTSHASTALRNLEYSKRFKVLALERFRLPSPNTVQTAAGTAASPEQHYPFQMYKKLNLPVTFNSGTTADIANVVDNSLQLIAVCDNAGGAASGNFSRLLYKTRVRYVG